MNRITVAKTGAYIIAGIAAVSSYGHQVHLLSLADLDPLFGIVPSEWITPVTVDSLAIIGLMVRTSDDVTDRTRRLAMLPLILAGGLSVAANVAMARNVVQVIVGVWTVLAYIVAELFVAKMERKAQEAKASKVAVKVTDAERAARKRAGYTDMSKVDKAAWTKQYRERSAKRTEATAPTSPGYGPVPKAPSAARVAKIAA